MDASIVAALSLGFLRGLQHALDPDHLVAVSTIVSEHKSVARFSLVGTFWGLGHTASLLGIGLVVIVFRSSIPEQTARWMEMSVALMLVALGINVVWQVARGRAPRFHSHIHSHEGQMPHRHIHLHDREGHDHKHHLVRLGRRPFLVGLVHGVAGSAALTLAILINIPTLALGLVYIALFGLGSIGGMLLMSAVIGLPFALTARRFSAINGVIRLLAGAFSVLFGLALAWNLLNDIGQINR